MRVLVACCVMMGLGLGMNATPARAQIETREGIALQNQILELRRDVQALRDQPGRAPVYAGAAPSSLAPRGGTSSSGGSDMTAQLLDRVASLEDQMRTLNGRIDELDNASQRRNADLAKQIGDLIFRVDNGSAPGGIRPAGSGSATPPAPGVPPAPPPAPAPVKRTPALALQEGNAALARRDYTVADTAAREVLAAGKTQPAAYDAQFLLAQAAYGQRNFPQAAIAYNEAYDRSRQGSHAQDSLLGLASSLNALGEKRSACAALDTLRQQFPSARVDVVQRAALTRTQAGCS